VLRLIDNLKGIESIEMLDLNNYQKLPFERPSWNRRNSKKLASYKKKLKIENRGKILNQLTSMHV